jgi:DNA-binding transcriptional ArsR family regulator
VVTSDKAELILHPVRMRILQAFSFGSDTRERTAQQIAATMPDVPQATLYRHLNTLVESGLLEVVNVRQVRGAGERVFALPQGGAILTSEDLASAGRADHLRYFATFLGGLLGDFARYLRRGEPDLEADGAGYRQFSLYLSDDELRELVAELNDVFTRAMARGPAPGRTRRVISRVILPAPGEPDAGAEHA